MSEVGAPDYPSIPVTVLTGFLGSGKTTLLNHLLGHPAMEETAVLINEFGDVGLDHLLVEQVSEDVVLLNSGCVCCTVRGDLIDSLRELFIKRVRAEVPQFRRVLIETTGLADPAPVIHTLMNDPVIAERYRMDGIVTTVDAVLGDGQLDSHEESLKQAAVADRIVMTKTDLAQDDAVAVLSRRLGQINPGATVIAAEHGRVEPDSLLDSGLYNPKTKAPDVSRWLNDEAYAKRHDHHHDVNRHDARIGSFCITATEPIPWPGFVTFLEALLGTHGENVLRVKGVLNIAGEDRPVAVHGVQHVFHPPTALPAWTGDDRRSRLVFITRDIGRKAIEDTFRAFIADAA
ncbi:MAG: GTP-binding protein [Rhodospirillales bacterium]|jgi:G3E family GTPase|nr:GTP-binding protein [Rhodospirillales bacterium]MDP6884074.1 GTP-binding protein [Rhodospirillales bacterium]